MGIRSAEEWLGSDNTLGLDIWKNKYQQNDETFDEWLDRISGGYAGVRSLIEQKKFLFAGRTLAYRGLEGNTAYSNCYVGGGYLDDSMEAIMDEAKTMAEVMKRGGGYGFALDKLRPKGAVVHNGAKYSGGIVPFMKMYSEITNAIAQGGSRKGALMLCLTDSHPDIFEFIHSKEDLTSIDKANISVKISDKFMDAVMKDEDWTTRFEVKATGEVIEKTFRAKDLWYDICYGSWDIGDPAIMFWDNVQYHSYLSEYVKDGDYEFVSSNPCAEYTSGSWGTCNLGSMNLSEYVLCNGCIPYFNWDDFEADIKTCVYALNDVIDENRERLPFVQQREYLDKYRPIGLGVMGYADCLIKLGFTYGSEDALNFTETLAHTLAFNALKASEAYAKERNCNFIEFCRNSIAKSPICKKIGYFPEYMANAQILSIAPTGTLATMLNVSGGIEPNFAFSYNRRTIGLHDKEVIYKVYAKIAEDYMKATGITDEESLPEFFIASQDIPWKERVKTQGIWQSYVDNAISSTVNLPNEATVEDIMGIYQTAWHYGLKGITVFRDGCRRLGILTTDKSENVEEENILSDKNVEENDVLPRGFVEQTSDDVLVLRRKLKTGCGNMYVLASWSWDDGTLKEVFVSRGSSGGCASNLNGLSRLASMSARAGVSLEDIVDQLQSVQVCPSYATAKATKEGISKGHSCPSAIGYALLDMKKQVDQILFTYPMDEDDIQRIKEYEKVKPKETKKPKCPNCGEDLIMEMGCVTCRSCGYSKCG